MDSVGQKLKEDITKMADLCSKITGASAWKSNGRKLGSFRSFFIQMAGSWAGITWRLSSSGIVNQSAYIRPLWEAWIASQHGDGGLRAVRLLCHCSLQKPHSEWNTSCVAFYDLAFKVTWWYFHHSLLVKAVIILPGFKGMGLLSEEDPRIWGPVLKSTTHFIPKFWVMEAYMYFLCWFSVFLLIFGDIVVAFHNYIKI